MNRTELKEAPPGAMIFLKNGITSVIDSPVKTEILKIVMQRELRFDEIVKTIKKAKSTISVHLHDLIDAGILAEKTDENDARRKYIYLDCDYLGTISKPETTGLTGEEFSAPEIVPEDLRPAAVFRLIFNTIRTSLLQTGVNIEPVLFNAGIQAGNNIAGLISSEDEQQFFNNLSDFFIKNELGEITVEEKDPWVITVKNCYECQDLPKINRPACSFDSGLLTSVFSIQTGHNVSVTETNCYAMGDSFCRFIISEKEQ